LTANATLEDVRAAAVTLSGKIAETWVNILLVRERLDVAWRQLETNEHILKLLRFRFVNSLATALDVLQQEETVAGSQAVLPGLKARERALLNELAVLMGRMPGQVAVETRTLPAVPAVPDTGLPADLLAARPDVRAAGLRLQASDWSVAAARADRLPALRLTARGEFFAEQVPNLFDNWLANLAGSVTGPIFDAGRREAEVERTRAVVRERLAAYEAVVARAIQEVQDALATGYFQGLEVQALDRQLAAARKSNRQASFRYQNGLIEYNVVLTELLNVQRLEQSVVQARADLLLERIRLGRALGGAWTLELDEPGPEAPSTQRSIHG
ncbi:MAG: RND transporter, partial [Deltaproteobacteria bacterium]|nr:RND transporter [Deltaproteobacteria bacterium]